MNQASAHRPPATGSCATDGEPPTSKWRPVPAHTLLIAAYPALHLLSVNLDETTYHVVFTPLLATLAFALTIGAVASSLLRDLRRGALVASALVVAFFSYGYVRDSLPESTAIGMALPATWTVGALCVAILAGRVRRHIVPVTRFLNLALAVLLVFPGFVVARAAAADTNERQNPGDVERIAIEQSRQTPGSVPDIVYLVFDRYGRADTLHNVYDFNNEPFLDALRQRGFQVDDQARANYPRTSFSLAAAMNMRYPNRDTQPDGEDSTEDFGLTVMHQLLDNRVSRELVTHGYRHVQIGSWWWPTATSPYADEVYSLDPLDEFTEAFVGTTLLQGWGPHVPALAQRLDRLRIRHARLDFQVDAVREAVAHHDGPTFVFMHAIMPHPPYVFRADGSYLPPEEIEELTLPEMYIDSVQHANTVILRLVDDLLAVPGDERPVIILQSDEGPHPLGVPGVDVSPRDDFPAWPNFTDGQLQEKFGILSALYLPGSTPPQLPDDLSPVNNFRFVLREYLGREDLTPLPNRSYVWRVGTRYDETIDVTERLKTPDAQLDDERRRAEAGI